MVSINFIRTLTADSTTAALAWERRGVTLSQIFCASCSSWGWYVARESRMKTCPHSVHSFRAVSSLLMVGVSKSVKAAARERHPDFN